MAENDPLYNSVQKVLIAIKNDINIHGPSFVGRYKAWKRKDDPPNRRVF